MNFSKTAVHRPVATFMCVLIALAFGFMSIFNLSIDLFPNMNVPIALVLTTYDGAGSSEIEQLITDPLESAMSTLSGIDTISSTSNNGSSMIILQFDSSVDIDLAALDIREQLDLVKAMLPDDADEPMLIKLDINSMSGILISATCEGTDISELYDLIDTKVSDRLERQNGVASVSVSGGKEQEVRVVLNQEKMRGYGISESAVTSTLSAENNNTPMGSVEQGNKNLTIRIKGEFESIEEIKNIPITTSTGTTVFLSDIADVSMIYEDLSSLAYTNGVPSINLMVQKQSTANTVNVSDAVLKELDKIRTEMPDVEFLVIMNSADYINDAISNVISTLVQGAILAVIILYLFLRNAKSTLIVGLSMPISVIFTFVMMYFSGITMNLMSLGGLTLGIGMLVDNSIVVLESIYKKLEEGCERKQAAIEGSREVVPSVIASTLTTVAVFVPIVYVGGTVGELFKDLSFSIAFSLLSSLIVAMTFVPMACSIFLDNDSVANVHTSNNIFVRILDVIGMGISSIEVGYKKLLNAALNHKRITMLVVLVFIVLTASVIPTMGFDFMPQSDEGTVSISISMPKGTKLEDTEIVAWQAVNAVKDTPEIKDISFSIGGGSMAVLTGASEDSASITINLVDKQEREKTSDQIASEMRKAVSNIPGADIEVSASSNSMGSYSSSGVEIVIKGDDIDTLGEIADEIAGIIETIPNTSEVKTSLENAAPQTTIKVDRKKAAQYGLSAANVSSIVRTAIAGSVATEYKMDGDEYDIRVMQDSDKIKFINDVENILIPISGGASVPLHEVAEIITEDVPVSISREDQQKYVSVTANINNIELSTVNSQISEKMENYIIPENYTWEFGGITENMTEAFLGLLFALIVSVLLIYMIMAAQFESFSYPFIVMFSMPIAITGGLLGLFITRQTITVTSFLGLIMLVGVVVNNAIVLIDYTNLLRRERGIEILQAMKIAGPTRLRPILMSTLTTVLGLLPMMLSTAEGSEMMTGLATVVVFGLLLSTLITLVLIPVIYVGLTTRIVRSSEKRKLKKQLKLEKRREKLNINK